MGSNVWGTTVSAGRHGQFVVERESSSALEVGFREKMWYTIENLMASNPMVKSRGRAPALSITRFHSEKRKFVHLMQFDGDHQD